MNNTPFFTRLGLNGPHKWAVYTTAKALGKSSSFSPDTDLRWIKRKKEGISFSTLTMTFWNRNWYQRLSYPKNSQEPYYGSWNSLLFSSLFLECVTC